MKTVVVFPCGSEIGLELHRCLAFSPHFRLIGASSVPDHGRFVYRDYVGDCPMVDDPLFPAAFVDVLESVGADYVFPAHDSVLTRLSALAEEGHLLAEVVAPEASVCRLCRSKSATYAFFEGKLAVPHRFRPDELRDNDFPVFLKPDAGNGSRGVMRADDRQALTEKLRRSPADIVLEYLPGREFTVDCFTDRRRNLLYLSGRERRRVANGISVNSMEVRDARFRAFAEVINRELHLRGPWFFQVKEDARGDLKLLEIAPRIAGTSGLARGKGVNLPLLALYDRLDLDLEIIDNHLDHVEIDRALDTRFRLSLDYDTAYLDLDDTVILGDQVNLDAIRFIFQCHNRNIKVILVTRHFEDPGAILRHHRLDRLFDEVVWLQSEEGKSTVIASRRAVFIDDSFVERQEVSESLGIPVFDPSSIDALMEG